MKGLAAVFVLGILLNGATKIAGNRCPQGLPEDPTEDILLPHESDCSKFYKCSHGEEVLQHCPEDLHFNPETNYCDWPHNVNCENSGTDNPKNETSPENECPIIGDPSINILLPHESDCTKFYQCSNGEKVLHNCPLGLYFNPETSKCDWPENVKCENNTDNSNEHNDEIPSEDDCPVDDPSVNILLPHESDCTKFYQCSNGEKVLHNCSVGLHFNPKTQQCEWPEEAGCEDSNGNGNNGNSTEENQNKEDHNNSVSENECPLEDPPEDILYPHEDNCSQFYKCSHGEKILQDCPEGLHFNPKTNVCDWPENANCGTGVRSENQNKEDHKNGVSENECPLEDPSEDILYPHEENCSQFYKCSHGEKILQYCPERLHFNPETNVCDWPENANCDTGVRYLPHESDCTKFYQITKGIKYECSCADGFHFNSVLQVCDYASNAKCQN